MKDYRLYHYAMKAYGLEDMAYAKAFMKKVLESDLSDPKSFVNKLIDKRYREFAAAFSFNGSATPVAQSGNQTDEMIGLYTATKKSQVDALAADTRYYSAEDRQHQQCRPTPEQRPSSQLCLSSIRDRLEQVAG